MVEIISLLGRFSGELCDLSVQRVEVSGQDDDRSTDQQEPVVVGTEIHQHTGDERGDQPQPGYRVGVDVYQLLRDRRKKEIHPCPLSV